MPRVTEPEYTTHSIKTDSTTNRLSYEVKRPLKLSLPFSREFEVNLINLTTQNCPGDHSRPTWIKSSASRTVNSLKIPVKLSLAHFSSQIDKVTNTPKAFTHTVGLARSPSQFFVHSSQEKHFVQSIFSSEEIDFGCLSDIKYWKYKAQCMWTRRKICSTARDY